MKKLVLLSLLLVPLAPAPVTAQTVSSSRINFAIPDIPAFKALGVEPSSILRPSTPEALAVTAAQFQDGNQIVLPQSFALEIAPYILARSHRITLQDYQKHATLYGFKVSAATQRDSTAATRFAVGFRLTPIDDGDMKCDREFLRDLMAILGDVQQLKDAYRDAYLKAHGISEEEYGANPDSIEAEVEKYALNEAADAKIEQLKESYKQQHWNAEKLDIALAIAASSPDSLLSDASFDALDMWTTYAAPVGEVGQFLVGGTLRLIDDDAKKETLVNGSLSARMYLGTNRWKGFGELQSTYEATSKHHRLLLQVGAELGVFDGVWGEFSAGLDSDTTNNTTSITSHFNLRLALPENGKLF